MKVCKDIMILFLAINSLQNNTLCDQRAILKKQKRKGVRVIVFQPLKVNSDESDVRLVFCRRFFLRASGFVEDPL